MFDRREAEWAKEAEARSKLMDEVIGGWKKQLDEQQKQKKEEREKVELERRQVSEVL